MVINSINAQVSFVFVIATVLAARLTRMRVHVIIDCMNGQMLRVMRAELVCGSFHRCSVDAGPVSMIEVSFIIITICLRVVTIIRLGGLAIIKTCCVLSAKCGSGEHQICQGVGPCCQELFV